MRAVCSVRLLVLSALAATARGGRQAAVLRYLFDTPLFRSVVVPQARATMVKTAEANGIPWNDALAWVRDEAGPWRDDALGRRPAAPAYYVARFHAYDAGNLCWQAAFEQEIASKAVGARNFPESGEMGEEVFRASFDVALDELGARVPDGGLVIDLGCGTGTSTRRLARRFPRAAALAGFDLSPHMVAVGRRLLALAPLGKLGEAAAAAEGRGAGVWIEAVPADARVRLRCADLAALPLLDGAADVVALSFVLHELPPSAARECLDEAARVLRPGGQLWVSEMDFESEPYAALRRNPLLYSLVRSTEPYLDDYADYQTRSLRADLLAAGFGPVRLGAATGRHFALVATKLPADARARADARAEPLLDDRRAATAKADTHLRTWQIKAEPKAGAKAKAEAEAKAKGRE
jgi:SAM-dependent methyltransferase